MRVTISHLLSRYGLRPIPALALATLLATTCITFHSSQSRAADFAPLSFEDGFELKLEERFTPKEIKTVLSDIHKLLGYEFSGVQSAPFKLIFGGETMAEVADYLEERIHLIYPPSVKNVNYGAATTQEQIESSQEIRTVATNFSAPLLFEGLKRDQRLSIRFNHVDIPVYSTRLGLLMMGDFYFTSASNPIYTSVFRASTLIHEARHSDCPKTPSLDDIARLKRGELPKNNFCGYPHAICPNLLQLPNGSFTPHPYAGFSACESRPWGAYAVEMIFNSAIGSKCKNCSEAEIQEAQMLALDALTRGPEIFPPMLRGVYGKPDMSSK
jgi:hypothetical protein